MAFDKSLLKIMADLKLNTSIGEICHGLPAELRTIFHHIKSLTFEAKPDYKQIYNLLETATKENCIAFRMFDWEIKSVSLTPKLAEIRLRKSKRSRTETVI
jgi:hypothetical protein